MLERNAILEKIKAGMVLSTEEMQFLNHLSVKGDSQAQTAITNHNNQASFSPQGTLTDKLPKVETPRSPEGTLMDKFGVGANGLNQFGLNQEKNNPYGGLSASATATKSSLPPSGSSPATNNQQKINKGLGMGLGLAQGGMQMYGDFNDINNRKELLAQNPTMTENYGFTKMVAQPDALDNQTIGSFNKEANKGLAMRSVGNVGKYTAMGAQFGGVGAGVGAAVGLGMSAFDFAKTQKEKGKYKDSFNEAEAKQKEFEDGAIYNNMVVGQKNAMRKQDDAYMNNLNKRRAFNTQTF